MPARNISARSLSRRPSVSCLKPCPPRPLLLEQTHDNSSASTSSSTSKLARLRLAVLKDLKDLETRLSQLESPLLELVDRHRAGSSQLVTVGSAQRARSGSLSAYAIDDALARIRGGIEMLNRIRADVCSHLPDFSLDGVRSHISSFEFPDIDLHLPSTSFTTPLDDVSLNLDKLQAPLSYIPILKDHLESLHEHLISLQLLSSLSSNLPTLSPDGIIFEQLHKLKDPDLFTDPLSSPLGFLGDSRRTLAFDPKVAERICETQIAAALKKSLNGDRLIFFQDLPYRYQNDEFVASGYRFIPLHRWPLLVLSIFRFHNETTNIWTHLIPLILAATTFVSSPGPFSPYIQSISKPPFNVAERVFGLFANLCLLSSCIWHVMSGCANRKAMETAARIDYVGIGWLISASIGSTMYYGFGCRPWTAALYLSVSFSLGVAGSILPFMEWFNERKNKKWRILFFLSLVFTLIIPMAHLAAVHSPLDMYFFIRAEFPSLASYGVGLVFYTFHFPECAIPKEWTRCTDWIGGGSHTIWHLFIVLAIKLHKDAMVEYRRGIGNEMCTLTLAVSNNLAYTFAG